MSGIGIVRFLLLAAGFAGVAGAAFVLIYGRLGWEFLTPLEVALAAFFGWAVLTLLERISRLFSAQIEHQRAIPTRPSTDRPSTISVPDYGAE